MDKFDELSNNELREQLKARNLGNFPVTDTTRNALIKKLRNAVNGPAKPVKGRRETLNIVKHSSAEESESDAELKKINKPKTVSNRRATIAAGAAPPKSTSITNGIVSDKAPAKAAVTAKPALATKAPAPAPAQAPVAVAAIIATTPSKVAPVRPKSPSRKPVAVPEPLLYFADASDDDLIAAAEEAENQTKRKSRTSRSPSLSKSSLVTTSYKHTIEPLIERDDDSVISINDNSDVEFSPEMIERVRKPTPTTKIYASADNRRKTMQLGPSISTNYTNIKGLEKPIEDTSSAYRRRYTTYTATTQNTHGSHGSNEDILNKVETPFLSDFTRRLAQLKAEQLPGGETTTTTTDYKSPKSSTSSYLNEYRSSTYNTSRYSSDRYRDKPLTTSVNQQKPSDWSAWYALEKKIRWPLIIILAVFVTVSVYVFLFTNY